MNNIKTHFAQAIKIFSIMAIVAAFAMSAFPTRSFAAANAGTLTVNVYKASSTPLSAVALQPLSNASIEVFNADGATIATGATNSNGSTTLELEKGVYKVRVSAPGYVSATGQARVDAGADATIKFELRSTTRLTTGGK